MEKRPREKASDVRFHRGFAEERSSPVCRLDAAEEQMAGALRAVLQGMLSAGGVVREETSQKTL